MDADRKRAWVQESEDWEGQLKALPAKNNVPASAVAEFAKIWNANNDRQLDAKKDWTTDATFQRYAFMFQAMDQHPNIAAKFAKTNGWVFAGYCLVMGLPFDLNSSDDAEIKGMSENLVRWREKLTTGDPFPYVTTSGKLSYRNFPQGNPKKQFQGLRYVLELFSGSKVATSQAKNADIVDCQPELDRVLKNAPKELNLHKVANYAVESLLKQIPTSARVARVKKQQALQEKREGTMSAHDALSAKEILAIHNALGTFDGGKFKPNPPYTFEDWVLWEFYLDLGLRNKEATLSQWKDLLDSGITEKCISVPFEKTKVQGKILPVPSELWDDLMAMKAERERQGQNDHGFIWISQNIDPKTGERMPYLKISDKGREKGVTLDTIDFTKEESFVGEKDAEFYYTNGLGQRVTKFLEIALRYSVGEALNRQRATPSKEEIDAIVAKERERRNLSTHAIRATFATMMWARCRDAVKLSYMLGHLKSDGQPDLEQSQEYIHVNWDDLADWYRQKEGETTMSIAHWIAKTKVKELRPIDDVLDKIAALNKMNDDLIEKTSGDQTLSQAEVKLFLEKVDQNRVEIEKLVTGEQESTQMLMEEVLQLRKLLELKEEEIQGVKKVKTLEIRQKLSERTESQLLHDVDVKAFAYALNAIHKKEASLRQLASADGFLHKKYPNARIVSHKTLAEWYRNWIDLGKVPKFVESEYDRVRETLPAR